VKQAEAAHGRTRDAPGRLVVLGWLAAAVLAAPGAQGAEIEGIRIMEHGVYALRRVEPSASSGEVTEIVLLESTNRVPAVLGTVFGLRYHVEGRPLGGRATITVLTRFPGEGLLDPDAEAPRASDRREVDVLLGDVRFHGYRISEPWELVPGDWAIELWSGEELMAQKTFTLHLP